MRTVLLLPLAVVAAVAGCRSQGNDETAPSQARRDLALPAQAPAVEIASPVELGRVPSRPAGRLTRRTSRPTPALHRSVGPAQLVPTAPVPVSAAAAPHAPPAAEPVIPAEPANDRELLPGKTVTVIPASSGPSIDSDGVDEMPPTAGRPMGVRGGTCRGRGRGHGPGVGIAGVPPAVLR